MKLILLPSSIVPSAVGPLVDSLAIDEVELPLSVILGAVDPLVDSLAVLHAVVECAFVYASILQSLCALPFLQVVNPAALVGLATLVPVSAVAICLVLLKLPLEEISIRVIESALAFRFAISPFPNVLRSVWPYLSAEAMLELCLLVDCSFIRRAIWHVQADHIRQIVISYLWFLRIASRRSEFVYLAFRNFIRVIWLTRGRASVGSHVVEDGRSTLGASRRLKALSNVV